MLASLPNPLFQSGIRPYESRTVQTIIFQVYSFFFICHLVLKRNIFQDTNSLHWPLGDSIFFKMPVQAQIEQGTKHLGLRCHAEAFELGKDRVG